MEIIVLFSGILAFAAFIFVLIEYPYYLVSVFVFLHLYSFNLEMPGPLDLRGLISVVLILRLVVFDKNNLDLIKQSLLGNKFFILIVVFNLYSTAVDISMSVNILVIAKSLILNIAAMVIGFLTIINNYWKKSLVLVFLMVGLLSTSDLVYSYLVRGALVIYKIIEVVIGLPSAYNHNFFGELCGYAFLATFLLLVTKNINKIWAYLLLAVTSLGILISTSRGTLLSVMLTFALILFTQKNLTINVRKIVFSALIGIVVLIAVGLSYSFILSAMNIKSEFSEQIYWRLIEEPLSIFDEDVEEFGWDNNKIQGTMRWRYYKYLRDADVFFNQYSSTVLFGFGTGGYRNIGEMNYDNPLHRQYSSHNFYINLLSENGIIGLLFFMTFFFSLIFSALKIISKGFVQFSFVYILIAMFFSTFGGDPKLTDGAPYILYGSVVAELFLVTQ